MASALHMKRTFAATRTPVNTKVSGSRLTHLSATRRELGAQLLAVGLGGFLGFAGAAGAAAGSASSSSASSSSSSGISSITITPINKEAKALLDRRDDAMNFKCKGGMFDCDGDRREFAHKQWMEWLDSGGVPKRIRDGRPSGPRAY